MNGSGDSIFALGIGSSLANSAPADNELEGSHNARARVVTVRAICAGSVLRTYAFALRQNLVAGGLAFAGRVTRIDDVVFVVAGTAIGTDLPVAGTSVDALIPRQLHYDDRRISLALIGKERCTCDPGGNQNNQVRDKPVPLACVHGILDQVTSTGKSGFTAAGPPM
jgi:hypothetical protein